MLSEQIKKAESYGDWVLKIIVSDRVVLRRMPVKDSQSLKVGQINDCAECLAGLGLGFATGLAESDTYRQPLTLPLLYK